LRKITFALSLILIFLIPWEGAAKFGGLGTATKLVGFLTTALWLAAILLTNRLRKPGLFQITVLLLVVWRATSTFWSPDPRNTIDHLVTWVQLFIFVSLIWDIYTTQIAVLAGLQAYVLGAYVAIAVALANFLAGKPFYDHYDRFSPSETTNPDGFGTMLAIGLPVAWYLASSSTLIQKSRIFQWINYFYIPAAFLGISLSGTRTALIAAIPAMAFGLSSLGRIKLWARILIFLVLTIAVLFLLPQVQTLRSFQRFSTIIPEITGGDLNNRTNNWQEGLNSFADRPLLGVGSNMYRSVNSWGKVAHNTYISTLVEVGLIGLFIFGAAVAVAVRQGWRQPMWDRRFWLTLFVVWALCASTLAWEDKKVTWLFLSLMVASGATARTAEEAEEPAPAQVPVGRTALQAE
jgi:O-antigen ligase